MIELKSTDRAFMAYQIYLVVGFLSIPFAAISMVRGGIIIAAIPIVTSTLCILNVVSYRKKNVLIIDPQIMSIMFIICNVIVTYSLGSIGAYWTFPTLLALFWVHKRNTALYLVSLFYVSVCITAYITMPFEAVARLAATLLMVAVFFNIAAGIFEKQYNELKKLTLTDHLTGAFNRRFMDDKINQLLARQQRFSAHASLITLDIDDFKKINDEHGHSVGDNVLIEIVKLIKSRIRVLDSVCRAGGEEFVILLPDTNETQAESLGEELRQSISDSCIVKNSAVTVSCGVSAAHPSDDRDGWLRRCDQALYSAKHKGKNRVVVLPSSFRPKVGGAELLASDEVTSEIM